MSSNHTTNDSKVFLAFATYSSDKDVEAMFDDFHGLKAYMWNRALQREIERKIDAVEANTKNQIANPMQRVKTDIVDKWRVWAESNAHEYEWDKRLAEDLFRAFKMNRIVRRIAAYTRALDYLNKNRELQAPRECWEGDAVKHMRYTNRINRVSDRMNELWSQYDAI